MMPLRADVIDASSWMHLADLPWSQPVLIRTDDGRVQKAVFDRNIPSGLNLRDLRQPGLLSGWFPERVEMVIARTRQSCVILLFVPACQKSNVTSPAGKGKLRIGHRIINLSGEGGRFALTEEHRQWLSMADASSVLVRFSSPSGSDTATVRLDRSTVKTWAEIYAVSSAPASAESRGAPPEVQGQPTLEDEISTTDLELANWRYRDDLPWSRRIVVNDPFEGQQAVVLDRDYRTNAWTGSETGLVSRWSRESIELHPYMIKASNGFTGNRSQTYMTEPVLEVTITSGSESLTVNDSQLDRSENRIIVNDSLAEFLRVAPINSTTILLKLPGQRSESFRIGTDTAKAWREIYSSLQPSGAKPASTPAQSRSDDTDTAKPIRHLNGLQSPPQKASTKSIDDGRHP